MIDPLVVTLLTLDWSKLGTEELDVRPERPMKGLWTPEKLEVEVRPVAVGPVTPKSGRKPKII